MIMDEKCKENMKLDFSKIKSAHDEFYKKSFFDVQIHCKFVIFPAHRYVLSTRSEFLAKQLTTGVIKLNWNQFEYITCTALLRWIYTNEVAFSSTDVPTAEHWLDLLHGSYKLRLDPLFIICEQTLLSLLVNNEPPRRFYDVVKRVGSNQLLEKCLELRLIVGSSEELDEEIDEVNTDHHYCSDSSNSLEGNYLHEVSKELVQINKLTLGYQEFRQFCDIEVIVGNDTWGAHAHVFESRSKTFLKEIEQTTRGRRRIYFNLIDMNEIKNELLRWIYTDCLILNDKKFDVTDLLKAAQLYELPTLFERCEQAIVQKVDLTSCASFHSIAEKRNSATILTCCNRLISQYFNKVKSPACFEMNVVHESPSGDNAVQESLLTLNDDCLLHLFRFVSLVDLGSIKDTCQRFRPLADQCFRLYRDISLHIDSCTMFADIWILNHFGKFITSLRVESFYERYASLDNILEMIARCTGEQLKTISFYESDKTEGDNFECLKSVLKNVECIELGWFTYSSNIDSLLNCCENLKEVNIDGELMNLSSDWCSKNPNITKVVLSGLHDDTILEEMCEKLTRLECVSVDCIKTETDKIIHLSRLSSTLKWLRIEAIRPSSTHTLQKFADKTVLTDLTLSFTFMTASLANVLGDFPNLATLVFENGADFGENVHAILSNKLASIENLFFVDCNEIKFNVIAKIVKNLLDLKKLSVVGCRKIRFIKRIDYLSLRRVRSLQIFVDSHVHERTRKLIGNHWLANVQVKRHK